MYLITRVNEQKYANIFAHRFFNNIAHIKKYYFHSIVDYKYEDSKNTEHWGGIPNFLLKSPSR